PPIDLRESQSTYTLTANLPGLTDKASLHLEFATPETLVLRGRLGPPPAPAAAAEKERNDDARRHGRGEESPKYWPRERRFGEFQSCFAFPGEVDVDAVEVNLEHGALRVAVPKRRGGIRRRVEIT
ncbi:HSP20-like chaperone, partial [Choiromyces venosus 120613-1]